jgi:DNA-binding CsgD family transcriptional regulator
MKSDRLSFSGEIACEALSTATFSQIIGAIYDCAIDPSRWPSTLRSLREVLGFRTAALGVNALPSGQALIVATDGISPEWLAAMPQYGDDVIEQWGGVEAVRAYDPDVPHVLSWVRDRSLYENNRYYVEWARLQGLFDVMAVVAARDLSAIGLFGFGRHEDDGIITQREVDIATQFVPHLQRAVAISRLLDVKTVTASTVASVLDTLSVAVVLVDADLVIVHANAAAECLLRTGDLLSVQRGVLRIRAPGAAAAIAAAVRGAPEEHRLGRKGMGVPILREDGTPQVLHVLPLSHGALRSRLSPRAVAAIFVAPPKSRPVRAAAAVVALFGLTPAEAAVLDSTLLGRTSAETARALGIGVATAKTHLHHIFEKTGTRRQSELVALVSSLTLPLAD